MKLIKLDNDRVRVTQLVQSSCSAGTRLSIRGWSQRLRVTKLSLPPGQTQPGPVTTRPGPIFVRNFRARPDRVQPGQAARPVQSSILHKHYYKRNS